MLESAQIAIDTMDRLKRQNDAFTKTLLDIVRPVNPADFPNPWDEEEFPDDEKE